MIGADLTTIILVFITLFIYFVIGTRRSVDIKTMDDYFFYSRRLDKPAYEKTFIVTGISLATVLFFFLDYGGMFGIPLIISPLMFCIGTYIFVLILPKLEQSGFLSKGSTLHNFIGKAFNFKTLRYSSAIISILGYLGIFVIELHVGVEIFKVFSTSSTWIVFAVLFIMTIIFFYTFLGGFKAVIDTDKLQFFIIVFATGLVLISLIIFQFTQPKVHQHQLIPFKGLMPISFIIVMIIGNVPFQILRMGHWQRAAAVGQRNIISQGLKKGIKVSFIFWALFGLIGLLLYWIADLNNPGAIVLLNLLRDNQVPYNYIVYPILFTGFVAALISTADSLFITILTSYIYDFRMHKEVHDENDDIISDLDSRVQKKGLQSARRAIVFFLISAAVLYVIMTRVIGFEFIDLLFVFFNQQLVLFPAVVLALKKPQGGANPARWPAFVGIWLGWLCVWVVSIIGKQSNLQNLVLLSAPIGWTVSILFTFILSPKRIMRVMRGE